MTRIVVVHDVLGTLFSLSSPIEELQTIFADQLEDEEAPPILAELIIMDWYHATQRDFTTLSINGSYQPIGSVFKSTLPRILLQAGLIPPNRYKKGSQKTLAKAGSGLALAGNENPFPDSVTERIMASLGRLQPRPGMVTAFKQTYRDQSLIPANVDRVEVWGATNGGLALGEKLFKGALGETADIFSGKEATSRLRRGGGQGVGLFSCDEVKTAKPDPKVYTAVRDRIEVKSDDTQSTSLWFVASHTWDLFAAKRAGFKTAWVGYEEFYTCDGIYNRPDIIAKDLEDVARQILAKEGTVN